MLPLKRKESALEGLKRGYKAKARTTKMISR
jgi:hypothetical protein